MSSAVQETVFEPLFEATVALDAQRLERLLRQALSDLGTLGFFEQVVDPFLDHLGQRWESGDIELYQEHFASERLTAFLSRHWYASPAGDRGHVVLAGLEGEDHVLGLHMAAMVFTECGWNPIFLGRDTPPDQIAACTAQVQATMVGVTTSVHTPPEETARKLARLRGVLPQGVQLLVGGAGAIEYPGCIRLTSLQDLIGQLA